MSTTSDLIDSIVKRHGDALHRIASDACCSIDAAQLSLHLALTELAERLDDLRAAVTPVAPSSHYIIAPPPYTPISAPAQATPAALEPDRGRAAAQARGPAARHPQ